EKASLPHGLSEKLSLPRDLSEKVSLTRGFIRNGPSCRVAALSSNCYFYLLGCPCSSTSNKSEVGKNRTVYVSMCVRARVCLCVCVYVCFSFFCLLTSPRS